MQALRKAIVCFLMISLSVCSYAQAGRNRSVNTSLNPTEGLTASQEEIQSRYNNKKIKNADTLSVYMLGVSFSFLDSVLYVTDVHKVDQAVVFNKSFLNNLDLFEHQLQSYLERQGNMSQVPVITFSQREKKLAKSLNRIEKRARKKLNLSVQRIGGEFRFISPSVE